MQKYLYLTKAQWCETWVLGGSIPIKLASTYLSPVRDGTRTPDENRIHRSSVDIAALNSQSNGFHFDGVRNLTVIGCISDGVAVPNFVNADYYREDGLILSFCNRKNNAICNRLGKAACVEIKSIEALKVIIDDQLGVVGVADQCKYTNDHQRSHFLKSTADAWQDEYRLFWPLKQSRWITLPPGVGRRIKIKASGA